MVSSVNLDDELAVQSYEVNDKVADDVLSSEFLAKLVGT